MKNNNKKSYIFSNKTNGVRVRDVGRNFCSVKLRIILPQINIAVNIQNAH